MVLGSRQRWILKAIHGLAWAIAGPFLGALAGTVILVVCLLIFARHVLTDDAPGSGFFLFGVWIQGAFIGLGAGLLKAAAVWEGWGAKSPKKSL
jgi:hypothetical protein